MGTFRGQLFAGAFGSLLLVLSACGGGGGGGGSGSTETASSTKHTTITAQTQIPPGATCPNGGVHIDWGIDSNGNGVLDSSEITGGADICNGTSPTQMGVAIANLADRGEVQTGFVVGTASNGSGNTVASVQLSLDFGPFASATGTSTWNYKLPTKTNTWKHGTSHTIIAIAKDANNIASPATILTVRKGLNHDVNGDGYPDLAVGTEQGANTYVFHGSSSGVPTIDLSQGGSANTTITTAAGQATNVALGDVNGDGFADLIVRSSIAGKVFIFHGGSSGIADTDLTASGTASSTITGGGTDGALALGDVNGDGYDDLALGASTSGSNAGAVYVFHGSSSGVTTTNLSTGGTANTTLTGPTAGFFGTALAMGNVNGDAYNDLTVTAPGTSSNTGAVYVFHGSSSGLIAGSPTGTFSAATTAIAGAASSGLGNSIGAGDVNGDGYSDLVVGSVNVEKTFVYHGSSTGVGASATTTLVGAGGFFGNAVAVGDVNKDGFADVIVAARGQSTYGTVYVFGGASTGVASVNLSTGGVATTTLTGTAYSDFGWAVAVGDLNGDGYGDLVVGQYFYSSGPGQVWIFNGARNGIPSGSDSSASSYLHGAGSSTIGWSVAMRKAGCGVLAVAVVRRSGIGRLRHRARPRSRRDRVCQASRPDCTTRPGAGLAQCGGVRGTAVVGGGLRQGAGC